MYCNNCGKQISELSKFCRFCGSVTKEDKEVTYRENAPKIDSEEFHAGFWLRFGAYFIDFMGVMLFAFIVAFILAMVDLSDLVENGGILVDYIFWVLYSTFFLSLWSSTPGKLVYGLKVLKNSGEQMELSSAFKRAALQPLSLLFFGAGYWNMDKDPEKKAWHDKFAKTFVVGEKRNSYIVPIILSILGVFAYGYIRLLLMGS